MEKLSLDPLKRQFFVKLQDLDSKEKISFAKKIEAKADTRAKTIRIHDFRDILDAIYPDVEGGVINRVMGEFKDGLVYNYEGFLNILYDISIERRGFQKFIEDVCFSLKRSQDEFWKDYDHEAMRNQDLHIKDFEALFRKYGISMTKKERDSLLFFCESTKNSENIDLNVLRDELGKNLMSSSTFIKDNKSTIKRPKRKIRECFDMILDAIAKRDLKVETYFEKFGWDSTRPIIHEKFFDRALRELNLDFTDLELETIKAELGLVDGKSELSLETLIGTTNKNNSSVVNPTQKKLEFVFEETLDLLKKSIKDLLNFMI